MMNQDACAARQIRVWPMKLAFALLLGTVSAVAVAGQSPFTGDWKHVWSCKGATGIYAQRCASGIRDEFELNLIASGHRICGLHFATAQLQNKVDEGDLAGPGPSITGTFSGDTAHVQFHSTWGGSGTAKLTLRGDTLHWKIMQEQGMAWLPIDAQLAKVSESVGKITSHACSR